ncbi:MAG: c-type cytochrome [Verrucomicrobia bacterium]|nr:c-type cytochrome [Verrucomicrobiota bacterium]
MNIRLLFSALLLVGCALAFPLAGATTKTKSVSKTTYKQVYGDTGKEPTLDAAKELPRFPAVEPKDALATFKIKKGFKLEFVAHEPQVADPIAVSFDERGRMFVCEMVDYSERRDETPHPGRIRMLEDKDGDGYFETATIFADNLAWPTALICYGGGIFVGATPDIIWLKDTKGTGKADVREVVFTGFGTGMAKLNVQGLMNNFNWGLDNRIHLQSGPGNRGLIECKRRPDLKPVELGARDFWFDPRTFDFGFEAGGGQYGFSYDTRGRKFVCSNSDHLQMFLYDDRYAARNPYYSMPSPRRSIAADGGAAEVFRLSPDEPWRIVRTRWRVSGAVKGAVEGGGRVSGYFTGATGTTVYRGDAYGPEFVNNTFTGDAGGGLMHRKILHPDGVGLIGKRPDDEQGYEFLASRDTWCRLVNFANAPDGCLYALDMYREVIEHPWSIPESIKQHLDLNSGNNRGRIYRIVPENFKRRPKFDFGKATTAELVATLEHPNGWHRDTAARLLHERNDKATIPLLEKMFSNSKSPLGRLHALNALTAFGPVRPATLVAALKDSDAAKREHAIRLSEAAFSLTPALSPGEREKRSPSSKQAKAAQTKTARIADVPPQSPPLPKGEGWGEGERSLLLEALLTLVKDPDSRVRFQLALTLGGLKDDGEMKITGALSSLGFRYAFPNSKNPGTISSEAEWMRHAVLSSRPEYAPGLFRRAMGVCPVQFMPEGLKYLVELARVIGARNEASGVAEVFSWITMTNASYAEWHSPVIRAFGEGLQRAGSSLAKADKEGKLKSVFANATKTAADGKASESSRVQAVSLLALTSFKESGEPLAACLRSGQPEPVQLAAITALGKFPDAGASAALLQNWPAYSQRARSEAMSVLLARPERATALLHAIESGSVKREQLNATQIESLQHHKTKAVAALAAKVLPVEKKVSRDELIQQFAAALTLKGDVAKGRAIYAERCISCHRAEGQGFQLGPDLVTVKTAGREKLLTSFLDPNREVAPQYLAFNIETKDGESYSGLIVADNAAGVTLRQAFGKEDVIPRTKIKTMRSPGQSLMPEGLEAGLTSQQMADLLEFIESAK